MASPICQWTKEQIRNNRKEIKILEPFILSNETNEAVEKTLKDYTLLSLNNNIWENILQHDFSSLEIKVPINENEVIELIMHEKNIFADDFNITNSRNEIYISKNSKHFYGYVKGHPNSYLSFSVTPTGIMGFIVKQHEVYNLGKLEGLDTYVIYEDKSLF